MKAVSQRIGPFEVVLPCRPDLEAHAHHVLKNFAAPGVQLREGLRVNIGWSALFAHRDPDARDRLVLHEPDFEGEPLSDHRPDASFTLTLLSTHLELARQLGARFVPSKYDQRLLIAPGEALSEEKVSLMRTADARFENDSGWLVFSEELRRPSWDEADRKILFAYELLRSRPALVDVLCLPFDYLAEFRGDKLAAIGSPDGARARLS
jgi:hypothetical protein